MEDSPKGDQSVLYDKVYEAGGSEMSGPGQNQLSSAGPSGDRLNDRGDQKKNTASNSQQHASIARANASSQQSQQQRAEGDQTKSQA